MKPVTWKGEVITKPGLYAGIPIWRYHERQDPETGEALQLCDKPSISSSGLRTIWEDSAADYWCRSPYNPNCIDEPESEHYVLGRALHHLALGEKLFSRAFAVRPEEIDGKAWHGNRTACKEWLQEQRAAGRGVLTQEQGWRVHGMLDSIKHHPAFRVGILGGLRECSIISKDKETGLWLKSRPDAVPLAENSYADLKSTNRVHGYDLMKAIGEYGYHQQAALTRTCVRAVLNRDVEHYALFFVQSVPPYSCHAVEIEPEDMDRGEQQNRAALEVFARGLAKNDWPGPNAHRPDFEYMPLPDWKRKQIDERLAQIAYDRKMRGAA